jgi:uncharacterized peroxidase-related enzyme
MTRLSAIHPEEATGKAKELLDVIQSNFGMTPNLMRIMAQSPAVLEGYMNFSGSLRSGTLDTQLREQIAIAVAETNRCEYCLSAHTAIGKLAGLADSELAAARRSTSRDPKIAAALRFAQTIVVTRGEVTDHEVNRVKDKGYTDGEIAEIIANVALSIFTNYFNHVALTEVDFPKIELRSNSLLDFAQPWSGAAP